MGPQRYERITEDDDDERSRSTIAAIPNSPPPSFHSLSTSRRSSRDRHGQSEEERDLNDAFDAPSEDEGDDENDQDQRRLIANSESHTSSRTPDVAGRSQPQSTASIPSFPITAGPTGRIHPSAPTNDGVFANINAKPSVGDEIDEKPPTYEQAAADATPPYWETTVLSPYATTGNPDDVFVDGLLVGSLFSFVWNALISMSFQLIGFLLTYLLHTTHAAKHGSRAGLGVTLIQYGFQMRAGSSRSSSDPASAPSVPVDSPPDDPNSHNFDPDAGAGAHAGITRNDFISYALMIVGWFLLIKAASNYMRARQQEALVRSSPDRGLGTAVVAEGERPESSV